MNLRQVLLNEYGVNTSKDLTEHTHKGDVNVDGDGDTTSTVGDAPDHVHKIFQWLVQPAEGHIHNLKE